MRKSRNDTDHSARRRPSRRKRRLIGIVALLAVVAIGVAVSQSARSA